MIFEQPESDKPDFNLEDLPRYREKLLSADAETLANCGQVYKEKGFEHVAELFQELSKIRQITEQTAQEKGLELPTEEEFAQFFMEIGDSKSYNSTIVTEANIPRFLLAITGQSSSKYENPKAMVLDRTRNASKYIAEDTEEFKILMSLTETVTEAHGLIKIRLGLYKSRKSKAAQLDNS